MERINWKNLPSKETPVSAENLILLEDNVENAIGSSVIKSTLFSNSSGQTGTITLNQNVSNFDLIIVYMGNSANVNEKKNLLIPIFAGIDRDHWNIRGTENYKGSGVVHVTGTTLTNTTSDLIGWSNEDIKIFYVFGIKFNNIS